MCFLLSLHTVVWDAVLPLAQSKGYFAFSFFFFLEREGKGGRKRQRETLVWEGHIDWLPLACPRLGTQPCNPGISPDGESHW